MARADIAQYISLQLSLVHLQADTSEVVALTTTAATAPIASTATSASSADAVDTSSSDSGDAPQDDDVTAVVAHPGESPLAQLEVNNTEPVTHDVSTSGSTDTASALDHYVAEQVCTTTHCIDTAL
jgi:hypothetical protein